MSLLRQMLIDWIEGGKAGAQASACAPVKNLYQRWIGFAEVEAVGREDGFESGVAVVPLAI